MPTIGNPEPVESKDGSGTESSRPMKFGLMTRSRLMGTRGLAASSIGWVLVGCIAFGFGVGALLDRQLGTAYWMPVLVMVGIAAGFREMFRTLAELNKQPPAQHKERTRSTSSAPGTASGRALGQRADGSLPSLEEKPRQRIFDVPPPPLASFDARSTAEPKSESAKEQIDEDDPKALIQKLLNANQGDEPEHKKPV